MRWESTTAAQSTAAAQDVWDVLLDGRRWPLWDDTIEWMVVEGPVRPGTVVTIKPKRLRQTALRIEHAEAPRLLALVVTFGPVAALRIRWELIPRAGGTAVAQTVAISGPLAGALLRRAAERIAAAMPAALERLAVRAASLGADPAL